MEIFEARVFRGKSIFTSEVYSVQSGVLPVYFPPKPFLQIFPCKNPFKIMIITSHMQKIIQIYPYRINKTQFSKSVIFQPKTKIFPQNPCLVNMDRFE
jgi:hypothetical protein